MRCCYLCQNYHLRDPEGVSICPKVVESGISEENARRPDSLKLLRCTYSTPTIRRVAFVRIDFRLPWADEFNLYACCPGVMTLFKRKIIEITVDRSRSGRIVYSIGGEEVRYCPCCREKLQLKETVERRMVGVRGKKSAKKRRGRPRKAKKAEEEE